jgi:hypothetical protein
MQWLQVCYIPTSMTMQLKTCTAKVVDEQRSFVQYWCWILFWVRSVPYCRYGAVGVQRTGTSEKWKIAYRHFGLMSFLQAWQPWLINLVQCTMTCGTLEVSVCRRCWLLITVSDEYGTVATLESAVSKLKLGTTCRVVPTNTYDVLNQSSRLIIFELLFYMMIACPTILVWEL